MSHELTVTDMKCSGCEESVTEAVAEIDGVTTVNADHEADRVVVEGSTNEESIREAIASAGFTLKNK